MEARNDKGYVKYHMPNFSDSMELLGISGIGTDAVENKDGKKNIQYLLIGRVSRGLGMLIDEINIPGINNYKELQEDIDCSDILTEMTVTIVDKILAFAYSDSKKKQSKKPQDSGQQGETPAF